ncbi:hypothetical protein AZE42_07456 [Rhizopogon vesiculosus]|uniref:LysM domain-containing protein n=1 Tax=Rhizopogon vesiculosus TaxID=180088 RepID=A0A1J8PY85_9AGAM|nr:hypothetical protein AZE42_07456 [Rhizopogon vesiculosus]
MYTSFFTKFVALMAIASSVAGQGLPANCDRTMTVQAGNTCDDISAAYNVSTYQLASVNNATIDASCDNLYVGEVLCLGITGQDCTTTHVIQSGDTCSSVSTAADISINLLLQNNPNVNTICTNLYPGEVLCTGNQTYVNVTYSK